MTKPVIAAVNGYAMGGGCEIALACHLVVADETAQFALSEVKVGLVAGAGGVVRLPRTIPPKVATEMILTGRRLSARGGQELGSGQRGDAGGQGPGRRARARRTDPGGLADLGADLAALMAETQGIADTVEAVRHRTPLFDELMTSEDALEGMTAFAEKRRPRWRNR